MLKSSIAITSTANPLIKDLVKLQQKKYRQEQERFLVEGARDIATASRHGWMPDILISADPTLLQQTPCSGQHIIVTAPLMQRVSGRDNPPDLIGRFAPRFASLDSTTCPRLLVLDGIRDPGNLGTILRTAHAAGGWTVALLGSTCDPWSPEAIRATQGSFAAVSLAQATVDDMIVWKNKHRARVIGTSLKATACDYRTLDYRGALAIVLGNERHGLSSAVADLCDLHALIPMPGGTESLNLSVAASLLLYQALEKPIGETT